MKILTGANINDITKLRQSDIFVSSTLTTVVGTVTVVGVLEGEALKMGTLLHTADGGLTWNVRPAAFDTSADTDQEVYFEGKIYKSTADNNTNDPSSLTDWEDLGAWDANGILYNDITATQKTTIVVTGSAKQKHLTSFDEFLRTTLFKNKLFLK